jgi:DNA-binding MarR family transcriptional regulator
MDNRNDKERLTSPFDLTYQQAEIENKIAAGLERISASFRVMLWDKAKVHGLSPIQLQILIFLREHPAELRTVSQISSEFKMTLPTISDSIATLEKKGLIERSINSKDGRSRELLLTNSGKELSHELDDFADPLKLAICKLSDPGKAELWRSLTGVIHALNKTGILGTQRMCLNCKYYSEQNGPNCELLGKPLFPQDIRLDCPDFIDATELPRQM